MSYDYELELVESMDRMEVFDNLELDSMGDIDKAPLGTGYFIIEDLQEFEEEL